MDLDKETKKESKEIIEMIKKSSNSYKKEEKNISMKKHSKSPKNISKKMSPKKKERLNEKILEMLEKMENLMKKKGDIFVSRIYLKAQDTILSETEDITDVEQLKGKPNIGPSIIAKAEEYVNTGTLAILEKEKENPINILTEIHGIGPKKAKDLVEKGIKKIEDFKGREDELLNNVQKLGLKYYEDINKRIPRNEIDEFKSIFDKEFKKVAEEDSKYEIVGSYRRGAKTSGDIDVIITSKNQGVFKKFIDSMRETGIILEILSYGNTKALVIAKMKDKPTARRVDFMYSSPEEYPFAILYFTGSKAFNTVMRGHALRLGVSLNEHGLYHKAKGKEKGEKIEKKFKEEKDIFEHLHLKYKEPELRIDGRSVEITNSIKEKQENKNKTEKKEVKKRKYTRKKKTEENIKIREPTINVEELPELTPIIKTEPEKTEKKEKKNITKKRKIILKKDSIVNMDTEKATKQFKELTEKGITAIENLEEKELENMIKSANEKYYNKQPIATDNEYDIVKEFLERKFPKNQVVNEVGAKVKKFKVQLPYEMASMDKIKPDTNALNKWKSKYTGPYMLSCKLDGVSGMYTTENGVKKLYTRGDGKIGQDISHMIEVLNLPDVENLVVRGEFIIPKSVFEEKYAKKFANPRNLVSGIVNSKTIDSKTKDLHFVAYEIIKPEMKPDQQFNKLEEFEFKVVKNQLEENITNESLSKILLDWRENYEYEIDGVIVNNNKVHIRKTGNPEHAFAFKMVISDQMAEAKVVDVIYTQSKNGYLKPRVRIEPIKLGGVTIEYATGFNASFIEENKIGIGAVITLIRSGDVIPYIKSVTTPAEKAKMPDLPYHWSETHVDAILDNVSDDIVVKEKNITSFFSDLGVDGLSSGNVKRIMKAGYTTVPLILHMRKEDFEKVEGFKEKMINKIYNGIQEKVEKATLIEIMAASNLFGVGIGLKKIKPIMESYPNILQSSETKEEKIEMLRTVPSIGPESAKTFVENIGKFLEFLQEARLEDKLTKKENKLVIEIKKDHILNGKKIVMTKVRDKYIIEQIEKVGATLENNIGKNTDILIVKSYDDVSNKVNKAKEMKLPIFTPADFVKEYDL